VWAVRALVTCGSCAALAWIAGGCGSAWWVLDIAAHFRVLQFCGLFVPAVALALLRSWLWCAVFLCCAGFAAWGLLPFWVGADAVREGGTRLRVASLNVLHGNRDTDRIRRFVRESGADVLLLIEVDRELLAALEPELRGFEHRLEVPRADPFGIALYARVPMQAMRDDELSPSRLPAIAAELKVGASRVRLVGLHPPPPITAANALERDQMIAEAVEFLCASDAEGILLGDLNTTPWAASLDRLAFSRGLRDARHGQGVLATWPADSRLLRIPIDHCLLRGAWRVVDMRVGEPCGSDHLGLIVDLALDG
jgi:endonuclease/exonuclease/phosphatase (EEP) superfamily protein YafD